MSLIEEGPLGKKQLNQQPAAGRGVVCSRVCEPSAGAWVQLHFHPLHSDSLILMLH